MTNPIPQSAIDAALKRYDYPSGRVEPSDAAHEERLAAALEAASLLIRKQVAQEIRAAATQISDAQHASIGFIPDTVAFILAGYEHAAQVAEGNQK